jgi:pimeloyl-ACP methyl ester carboxylesterase
MRWAALALTILLPLGAAIAVLSSFQSSFVFPTGSVRTVRMPADAQALETVSSDGRTVLRGLHFEPTEKRADPRLILGFGGNGWNAIDTAHALRQLYPSDHVVAFFYRGYPPSGGSPSSDALIADAPLVLDAAVAATGTKRAIAVGFSIGTGVVTTLATQRAIEGMILVTPFDSLERVAADHLPWAPMGSLFRHEIDAAVAIASVRTPSAIIAAANDEMIWTRRTDGLRAAATNLVMDRTIPDVGHNDIYTVPAFRHAMIDALEKLSEMP